MNEPRLIDYDEEKIYIRMRQDVILGGRKYREGEIYRVRGIKPHGPSMQSVYVVDGPTETNYYLSKTIQGKAYIFTNEAELVLDPEAARQGKREAGQIKKTIRAIDMEA